MPKYRVRKRKIDCKIGCSWPAGTAVLAVSAPAAAAISEVLVDDNQLLKKGNPTAEAKGGGSR